MKKHKTLMRMVLVLTVMHWSASVSAQLTKVAIGYSGISADQLVIWVAKDAGIFAKNNIDAQTVYFSGGTTSVTAMISGDTPLIQASGPGIVSAGLAGAEPIYVVGGITTLDYWLMTQPEIKTPEQLKGGTIAVARFGGAADFVARYALARLGLTPGKNVSCKPAARRNDWRRWSRAGLAVAPWCRRRCLPQKRRAFICSRMSRLWAWHTSIKAALRLKDTCVNIRTSSATSSNHISSPCTGSKAIAHLD